jgi:hypothetical protein
MIFSLGDSRRAAGLGSPSRARGLIDGQRAMAHPAKTNASEAKG